VADESSQPSLILRAAAVLEDWWAACCTALGAVVLALLSLTDSNHHRVNIPTHPTPALVLIVGGVLTAAGLAGTQRRIRGHDRLAGEVRRLQAEVTAGATALEVLARIELEALNTHLKHFSNERLSLFVRAGDSFKLLARFSKSPGYTTLTRSQYELDEGCRGRAWEAGEGRDAVVIDDTARTEPWVHAHMETGMTREAVDALRMPARTVVAIRIDDPRAAQLPLGVLVVESISTYRDIGIGGHALTAILDPEAIIAKVERSMRRLQGVLAVFAELSRSTPSSADTVAPQ
jgi:hypothetical protein